MKGLKAVNDQKGALLEGAKGLQQGLETLNQSLAAVNLDGQSVDMQPMSVAAVALGQDAANYVGSDFRVDEGTASVFFAGRGFIYKGGAGLSGVDGDLSPSAEAEGT